MTVRVSALDEDGLAQFATIIMEAGVDCQVKLEAAVKAAVGSWSRVMGNEVLSVIMEMNSSERLLEAPRIGRRLRLLQGGGLLTGAIERSLKLVGCRDSDVRETANQLDVYLP